MLHFRLVVSVRKWTSFLSVSIARAGVGGAQDGLLCSWLRWLLQAVFPRYSAAGRSGNFP